jgi:hypothetical protein
MNREASSRKLQDEISFVSQELQNEQLIKESQLEELPVVEELETTTSYSSAIPNIWKNDSVISAISSVEGRLRATLLKNYDRNSYPWEWAWAQKFELVDYDREGDKLDVNEAQNASTDAGLRQGLPIEFGLNFHKVHALNVAESTADLIVWVRVKWTDPRLAWNPEDFDGLKNTWFFVSDGMGGGEASEIWTPDMYLWNQEEPMANTLANTFATVSSDGSIFWSRPGRIKSTCKYVGLENFPFDKLGCSLEFGSWAHSGLYFRPIPLGGTGYSVGGSETSGGSYTEFELDPEDVSVESIIYPPYPGSPEEDWPVLIYTLLFDRASAPYVRGVVLINILLNFAAFACFWIPPHVGERMGLAITCVLAAVAGELVVAAILPVCKEMSWYTRFTLGSTSFALIVVFESAIVIYFFYYTGDDLKPSSYKWATQKFRRWKIDRIESKVRKEWEKPENRMSHTDSTDIGGDNGGLRKHRRVSWNDDGVIDISNDLKDDSRLNGIMKNTSDSVRSSRDLSLRSDAAVGQMSRHESLAATKDMWMSDRSLVMQMADAGNFKNEKEAANNADWQQIAENVDEAARFFVIPLYCAFLGYIFSLAK